MKAQMGRAFPTEKLDRSNIASWKYKMHQYLVGQRILGLYRRSPRKSTQLGTCRLPSLGANIESCAILSGIMCPWSHAWLHSRCENSKRSLGQPQEDLCSQHGRVQYVHVPDEKRKKLDAKAGKCILVGYSHEQKGYKCYNPQTKQVLLFPSNPQIHLNIRTLDTTMLWCKCYVLTNTSNIKLCV